MTGQPKSSYVDYAKLGRALAMARAEAVWVGWGFVAEHAEFADLCREIGIVFIGPDGDVMRMLGDKITSKRLAEEAADTCSTLERRRRWRRSTTPYGTPSAWAIRS